MNENREFYISSLIEYCNNYINPDSKVITDYSEYLKSHARNEILNSISERIFDSINSLKLLNNKCYHFRIKGRPGCGKTQLIHLLIKKYLKNTKDSFSIILINILSCQDLNIEEFIDQYIQGSYDQFMNDSKINSNSRFNDYFSKIITYYNTVTKDDKFNSKKKKTRRSTNKVRILVIDEVDQINNKNNDSLQKLMIKNNIILITITNDCNYNFDIRKFNNNSKELISFDYDIKPYNSDEINKFIIALLDQYHKYKYFTIELNHHVKKSFIDYLSKYSSFKFNGDIRLTLEYFNKTLEYILINDQNSLDSTYLKEFEKLEIAKINLEIPYSKKILLFLITYNLELNLNDSLNLNSIEKSYYNINSNEFYTPSIEEDLYYLCNNGYIEYEIYRSNTSKSISKPKTNRLSPISNNIKSKSINKSKSNKSQLNANYETNTKINLTKSIQYCKNVLKKDWDEIYENFADKIVFE